MPRFFFDIDENGVTSRDDEGLELPDVDRAMAEAMETLPGIARDAYAGRAFWTVRSRVRDEIGHLVFEATLKLQTRQFYRGGASGSEAP
jgi:hypothetical protein